MFYPFKIIFECIYFLLLCEHFCFSRILSLSLWPVPILTRPTECCSSSSQINSTINNLVCYDILTFVRRHYFIYLHLSFGKCLVICMLICESEFSRFTKCVEWRLLNVASFCANIRIYTHIYSLFICITTIYALIWKVCCQKLHFFTVAGGFVLSRIW